MSEIPEAIAEKLATLNDGVEQMRAGLVDKETVENIVKDVVAEQRAAENPAGYSPDDHNPDVPGLLNGSLEERMTQLHSRDADRVASVTRSTPDTIREFQKRADNVSLLQTIMSRGGEEPYDVRQSEYYREEFAPLARAVDTQTTAEGTEWVPRGLSNELLRRVNLKLRVPSLFREIVQPTPVFDFPATSVTRTRTGYLAENTADTGQTKASVITPGTRKITLTAKKFAVRVLTSKEAEEDSIVAVLPWITDEIVDYLSADLEDAIINGDTTATHQDSNVTASDDIRKVFAGLRKQALAAGTKVDAAAALSVAKLRAVRKLMGKYAVDPNNLAHIVDVAGYIDLLSDSNVQTLQNFGPQATILSGQLAAVDGSPVIVSEFMQHNLNASGVYDGTTTTKGAAITVHTGSFIRGVTRGLTTQVLRELYAESDQDAIVATMRRSWATIYPTTETTVGIAYDVT